MADPIAPFLQRQGALILDGGLATELERRGHDLSDELWSARLLRDDPDAIRRVHLAYYGAGADCCTSASYQATIPGFVRSGMSPDEAREVIRRAVRLVIEARDEFWAVGANRAGRLRPLAAAGVGPYGAYLADGSEYTGTYDLDEAGLIDFHRERWAILAGGGADILACETIPSLAEARALARLLSETPGVYAWFSFSCRDGAHISDGTPIADCAAFLADFERVTRQADQPFDVVGLRFLGIFEHDHVPALGVTEFIRKFVHEDTIALEYLLPINFLRMLTVRANRGVDAIAWHQDACGTEIVAGTNHVVTATLAAGHVLVGTVQGWSHGPGGNHKRFRLEGAKHKGQHERDDNRFDSIAEPVRLRSRRGGGVGGDGHVLRG